MKTESVETRGVQNVMLMLIRRWIVLCNVQEKLASVRAGGSG